jgi:hypothetical protein
MLRICYFSRACRRPCLNLLTNYKVCGYNQVPKSVFSSFEALIKCTYLHPYVVHRDFSLHILLNEVDV